ncbi:MAG: ankyrin repeat domain-containing protein [Burkholderiales bacterium]|nr:ankyrin repeat domain-containing protein [Burkholderiales bacterium]
MPKQFLSKSSTLLLTAVAVFLAPSAFAQLPSVAQACAPLSAADAQDKNVVAYQKQSCLEAKQREKDNLVLKKRDELGQFFRACKINNSEVISQLLQESFDPNQVEPERGETCLMLAIREDAGKVVELLLASKKINLEAKANNGDNALMIASYKGAANIVKTLIDHGAEVNRPGWAPLHYAAFIGNNEVVQILLDASAYIDAEAPNKNTPIMMAAYGGHIYTAKLLLDEGADATLKNDRGQTAIDMALLSNHQDIADGLLFQLKKQGKPVPANTSSNANPPANHGAKFDNSKD